MRGLVQILFGPADLVLARLAVPANAVQFLHRLAADVAYRDLGVLTLALGLFDQLPAAFLGELRDRHPDQGAVVGGVDAQVGVADRRLDRAHLAGFVGLDDDEAGLGHVDAGQLGDGRGRAVVVDHDPREHAGVGTPRSDGRQVVAGNRYGL